MPDTPAFRWPAGPRPLNPQSTWLAASFAESPTAPFSGEELFELTRHLAPVDLAFGEVLFREGQLPEGVWILQAGAIELSFGARRNRTVIRIINPGEAVGDIQILGNAASNFKAVAAEPSTCLFLARPDFLSLLARSPTVSQRWMAKLAVQVSRNHSRIVSLLTNTLRDRLAQFLLNEGVDGAFRHSQATIASMLGVHRSSVNQVLRQFEAMGLIRLAYRCVEVVDPQGLKRLLEGRFVPT